MFASLVWFGLWSIPVNHFFSLYHLLNDILTIWYRLSVSKSFFLLLFDWTIWHLYTYKQRERNSGVVYRLNYYYWNFFFGEFFPLSSFFFFDFWFYLLPSFIFFFFTFNYYYDRFDFYWFDLRMEWNGMQKKTRELSPSSFCYRLGCIIVMVVIYIYYGWWWWWLSWLLLIIC